MLEEKMRLNFTVFCVFFKIFLTSDVRNKKITALVAAAHDDIHTSLNYAQSNSRGLLEAR